MKRTIPSLAAVAAGLVAPAALAATAVAAPAHHTPAHHAAPAGRHAHGHRIATAIHTLSSLDQRYLKLYHEAQSKLGTRAPGRNIVRDGLTASKPATNAIIEKSIGTLSGMLATADSTTVTTTVTGTDSTATAESATTATAPDAESAAPAASGLTACIIERESGGDSTVVNSSGHMGEGQWDESTWLADGGGAYGATPLDASASEQQQVIASQVAAGNTGQWTDYDGC